MDVSLYVYNVLIVPQAQVVATLNYKKELLLSTQYDIALPTYNVDIWVQPPKTIL